MKVSEWHETHDHGNDEFGQWYNSCIVIRVSNHSGEAAQIEPANCSQITLTGLWWHMFQWHGIATVSSQTEFLTGMHCFKSNRLVFAAPNQVEHTIVITGDSIKIFWLSNRNQVWCSFTEWLSLDLYMYVCVFIYEFILCIFFVFIITEENDLVTYVN